MADVLLVDWLGRGGIAQTSLAWSRAMSDAGASVDVVTRPSPLFPGSHVVHRRVPGPVGSVELHWRLARTATRALHAERPDHVVVQNTVIPMVEIGLIRAAQANGIASTLVLHNARPHSRVSGSAVGLRRLVADAGQIVTLSGHVARQVENHFDRTARVVHHPLPPDLVEAAPEQPPELTDDGRLVALAFGVMRRGYKGLDMVGKVAAKLGGDWRVVAAGVGSGRLASRRVTAIDRFLSASELRWLLERAAVTLMPYRSASQSGAAVAAQYFRAPPIAAGVGALPEQVDHGEDGLLMAPDAPVGAWLDALARIDDEPAWWATVSEKAHQQAATRGTQSQTQFVEALGLR